MSKRKGEIKWRQDFIEEVANKGWKSATVTEHLQRIANEQLLGNKSEQPVTLPASSGYNRIFAEIISSTPQGPPRLE